MCKHIYLFTPHQSLLTMCLFIYLVISLLWRHMACIGFPKQMVIWFLHELVLTCEKSWQKCQTIFYDEPKKLFLKSEIHVDCSLYGISDLASSLIFQNITKLCLSTSKSFFSLNIISFLRNIESNTHLTVQKYTPLVSTRPLHATSQFSCTCRGVIHGDNMSCTFFFHVNIYQEDILIGYLALQTPRGKSNSWTPRNKENTLEA